MTEYTENTNTTSAPSAETTEDKKNFTENLTDVIKRIQEAKDGVAKRHEELHDLAPEDTSEAKILAQHAAEILGEGAANAKAAYEAAGGIEGISETAVKKAAELSATARVLGENIADSDAFKSALEAVKTGSAKAAETGFFKGIIEEADKLKSVALETYNATYEAKKAPASEPKPEEGAPSQ